MAVGSFFFSAGPTAQNSPELHFRFIISFIQSSLLRSLILAQNIDFNRKKKSTFQKSILDMSVLYCNLTSRFDSAYIMYMYVIKEKAASMNEF